jgi:hypothetical protein
MLHGELKSDHIADVMGDKVDLSNSEGRNYIRDIARLGLLIEAAGRL